MLTFYDTDQEAQDRKWKVEQEKEKQEYSLSHTQDGDPHPDRRFYVDRQDPIVFIPLTVITSIVVYGSIWYVIMLQVQDHR